MPYLTNLAQIARRTGFPVVEQPGWKTRGHGSMSSVKSVMAHHDAARQGRSTFNTVIQNGHSSLAGPLAHFALRRDGTIHVVAAGLCYHAGVVSNYALYGNNHSIGIEAGNDGLGEPWPDVQIRAYKALCAELCKAYGLNASRVVGHKEVAVPRGRKPDPAGINMTAFRSDVARLMSGGGGSAPPAAKPIEIEDEEDLSMELKPGRVSRYFRVREGKKNVHVACPHDEMAARIKWHGPKYPKTKGQFPLPGSKNPDADWIVEDDVNMHIHAMRPWNVKIPKGAVGFTLEYTYRPEGSRDEYVASLDFS